MDLAAERAQIEHRLVVPVLGEIRFLGDKRLQRLGDTLLDEDRLAVEAHDLVDRPMVLLDLPATQDYFLNYFHAHGLIPDVQYRLKSFEMVRTLVGAGAGFSFGFLPLPVTRFVPGESASCGVRSWSPFPDRRSAWRSSRMRCRLAAWKRSWSPPAPR